MSVTPSTNMNMPIPGVGTESGPQYASDINASLTIVDAHDHSAGYGVPVTPDGLNINGDLPFGENNATMLRSARFSIQVTPISDPTDLACLYSSGVDLYFNDGNGNQIQITQSGGIAGSPGSISNLTSPASASYVAGSTKFVWQAGVNKAATMDGGALIIRETNVSSANGITVQSPTSLASAYALTLPTALPGSSQYVTVDASGNMSFSTANAIAAAMTSTGANAIAATMTSTGADDIGSDMTSTGANAIGSAMTSTGANAVANSRTRAVASTVGIGGVAISGTSSNYSTSSTTYQDIPNVNVDIDTSGRPVQISFMGDGSGNESYFATNAATDLAGALFRLTRDGSAIGNPFRLQNQANASGSNLTLIAIPPSCIQFVDPVGAGSAYTYQLQVKCDPSAFAKFAFVNYVKMVVYEL